MFFKKHLKTFADVNGLTNAAVLLISGFIFIDKAKVFGIDKAKRSLW